MAFVAAVVPAMVCFALMPLLVYKILDPELKRTPEAKELGRKAVMLYIKSADQRRIVPIQLKKG